MGLKTKIDTGYFDKNGTPICVGDKVKKWGEIGIVKTDKFGSCFGYCKFVIEQEDGWLDIFDDMDYIGRHNFEVIK